MFAESLGASKLVIGLTIVAGGTSLPEVADLGDGRPSEAIATSPSATSSGATSSISWAPWD